LGKPTPPAGDPAPRPPAPCLAPPAADKEKGATIPTPVADCAPALRGKLRTLQCHLPTNTNVEDEIDIDGNGHIMQTEEYNRGFDILDKDHNGFLTRSEFGIASKLLFNLLDKDGDGKLSRKEYEADFALMDINRDSGCKIDKKVESKRDLFAAFPNLYILPTNIEEEIEVESKRDLSTDFPTDVLADVSEEQHASILRSSVLSLKPGEWESMNQRDRELFLQVLVLPGCF
jgi:hypothetical protein